MKIAPSLLSADFLRLSEEVKSIEEAGAEYLHLDIMDGMFVPNISFGFPVLNALRPLSSLVFDVHLMIEEPLRYITRFAEAGADIITVHHEACNNTLDTLKAIRASGKKAGLSIKPSTEAEVIFPYLDKCDLVLVMTVEPGFGGQKLIPSTVEKIRVLRAELDRRGLSAELEADGGIHDGNAGELISAGADVLVAGSSVFGMPDRTAAVLSLRK